MAAGVSVIICCYNSSLRLNETLKHLKNQIIQDIGLEIIIVDNASTDDTAAYAEKILSTGNTAYSIVSEPESGLSNARKKGYTTAKYEYLLYCDDDNWLAENYVQLAYNTMANNLKIGILGGLAEASFEAAPPDWFKKYAIDFAVGEQSLSKDTLSLVSEVYGAGFVIRKSYLDKLYASGFKSILSDRKGNQLVSGGDVEFCYLAKSFGFEVWYNRDLKFMHYMPMARLNWDYMKRLYAGNGKTNVYMTAYRYVDLYNCVPNQNLRLPFWLDTFVHKVKAIVAFYPKVARIKNPEGNADVLRFIAMKTEALEIWALKKDYSTLYDKVYANQNLGKR